MKKVILFLIVVTVFVSCSNNDEQIKNLQTRVDSLQAKLNATHSAGFGEIMTNIQVHHAKLWFAGKNQNWDLSHYEIAEIKESFDDIVKYEKARPESEMVPMITPALDSVSSAIKNKNFAEFENAFKFMTNTCNDCHLATNHEYNVVVIPQTPPFSNQDFKKQ